MSEDTDTRLETIVRSVLYEGYALYPYRPDAAKNRLRWTLGGIHPPAWTRASAGSDSDGALVTCLLEGPPGTEVGVSVGFLQPLLRGVGRVDPPAASFDRSRPPAVEPVDALRIGGTVHAPGEEAAEERVAAGEAAVAELAARPLVAEVDLPGSTTVEPLLEDGRVAGLATRRRLPLQALITTAAEPAGDLLWRVSVDIRNVTDTGPTPPGGRPAAMLQSLVSAHAVLRCRGLGARWLSLADPPDHAAALAAGCPWRGLWPVLVDAASTVVLASPIILEDRPEVAPESPGDLFDATEIDEMLTLRILTLTAEEKASMRAADPRTAALLDRTEGLDGGQIARLHGTVRSLRPPL